MSGQIFSEFPTSARQGTATRGVFRDVEELMMTMGAYIDHHDEQPRPFIWTAKAADLLEKSSAR